MPKRLEYINNVRKGVSLSKANLAISKEEIAEVCQRYELLSDFIFEEETNKYLGYVQMAMDYCLPKNGKLISYDFDDMIWLPIACNLPVRRYDWVLVDEAQDLNKAQIELCIRACNTKGRILACGDNRQAIYGWRGAALDAMDNFIDRLSAKVLPLSITYRCPKKVVAEVNHIVEDFSAHESAPEGIVDNVSDKEMIDKVGAGDFILSRTNAPLIKYCFQLLKMGRKAAIAGRDIGEALAMMVKKSGANTVPELQAWLEDWIDAERARLEKKNSDDIGKQMSIREDKKECIEAFMEGCATVGQVLIKIESLFSDDKNQMDQVLLSTTHKAKGLERNKVYMLRWTYGKRPGAEEDNLFYVAATRAKAELHYVSQGK
jgi:superfamily I DNA/RNA helicase